MLPAVAVVVHQFERSLITYTELVEALVGFISENLSQATAITASLEGLPDELLAELRQDVERTLRHPRYP